MSTTLRRLSAPESRRVLPGSKWVISLRLVFGQIARKLGTRRVLSRNVVIIGGGARGEPLIDHLERQSRA